jgi:hypothetical protein
MKVVKTIQNYECQFADGKTISGNLEDSQFESKLIENDSQCEKISSTTKLLFERPFDEKNEIKNLEVYESFNQKYNIIEITYDWTSKKSSFRIIINSEPTIQDKDYYKRIITTHVELFKNRARELLEIGYEEDGKYNTMYKNDNIINKEIFGTINFRKIKNTFMSIYEYIKTSEFENYIKDNQNKLENFVDKYFKKDDDPERLIIREEVMNLEGPHDTEDVYEDEVESYCD